MQADDILHGALSKTALADHTGAPVVLQGDGEQLRGGRRSLILQYDQWQRDVGAGRVGPLLAEDLSAAATGPYEHALGHEHVGDHHRLGHVTAGVAAQVEHHARELRAGGAAQVLEAALDQLRGAATKRAHAHVGELAAVVLDHFALDQVLRLAREHQAQGDRRGVAASLDRQLERVAVGSEQQRRGLGLRQQEPDVLAVDLQDLIAGV